RSLLVRSGDVEKDELVRSLRVVGEGGLHGITGIAQVGEAHALDHAPAVDVEARHNALAQHQRSASARASRRHTAPVQRARPTRTPSTRGMPATCRMSSSDPTPPEANTGMPAARATASVLQTLGPFCVPSRAMSV